MAWIQLAAILLFASIVISKDIVWQHPGCHKVGKPWSESAVYFIFKFELIFRFNSLHIEGHARKIEIPDCVQFTIDTNACRGYCESYAVPSGSLGTVGKPSQAITSVGQCCNIMETEDVNVILNCLGGQRNLTFKSATKCSCYHCKKD